MVDTISGTDLILRARRIADQEGATIRFTTAEALDYVNEGIKELWDILCCPRGWPWAGLSYLGYGTVTQSVSADAAVTFSGNPVGDFDIHIQITTGGDRGAAVFKWSINGGSSYTTSVTTAASVTLGNTGVVAAFGTVAGTDYTLGGIYTCLTTPLLTVAGQRWYDLPSDFYLGHTISAEVTGGRTYLLEELQSKSEPLMRDLSINPSGAPLYYQFQSSRTGAVQLGLWPQPTANVKIRINYFRLAPTLASASATVDSVNGWIQYAAFYAARQMGAKDEDWDLVKFCSVELERIKKRIDGIANSRSMSDAPRIQNVLQARRIRSLRYWSI